MCDVNFVPELSKTWSWILKERRVEFNIVLDFEEELNLSMAWPKLPREMLEMQFYWSHAQSYSRSKACEYTWQSSNPRTIFQLAKVGECCLQMNSVCMYVFYWQYRTSLSPASDDIIYQLFFTVNIIQSGW